MSIRSAIVAQFKRPRGPVGRLVGWIMANRPSNVARNLWTVERLDLRDGQQILEIGCGPGLALGFCARRQASGHILGLDHSAAMIDQARSRLADEIASGKVTLECGGLERLASRRASFDRIFCVNVAQFFPDLGDAFRAIHDSLKPGGMVAVTFQPRSKSPTRQEALAMAERFQAALVRAGFESSERHELPMRPAPAICVTARRPDRD